MSKLPTRRVFVSEFQGYDTDVQIAWFHSFIKKRIGKEIVLYAIIEHMEGDIEEVPVQSICFIDKPNYNKPFYKRLFNIQ